MPPRRRRWPAYLLAAAVVLAVVTAARAQDYSNGDDEEEKPKPQLKAQDRAAWRLRAMILAINGRNDEATEIVNATMPAALAQNIIPYLVKLDRLNPAQQAAAAHFGRFPSGQLGPPRKPVQIAAATPPPAPAPPPAQTGGKRKARDADDAVEGKKKRKVKPKDPNAPKRPASSYLMFQNDVRQELKAKNPHLPNNELLNLIAKAWSEMPKEQKDVRW